MTAEGAGAVRTVSADAVKAEQEGKLVHLTGQATTSETLSDPDFKISANAIALERRVEMFQWVEESHTENVKDSSGKVVKTYTVYTHNREWKDRPIASSSFHEDGYTNPPMPFESKKLTAASVTLGAFTLPPELVEKISSTEEVTLTEAQARALGKLKAKLDSNKFVIGEDPLSPEIGDVRITFAQVKPQVVSAVAAKKGASFAAWKSGDGSDVLLLEAGPHTAKEMFASAQTSSSTLATFIRIVGWTLMLFALRLLFKPLVNSAEFLPRLANALGAGKNVFGFFAASGLSTVLVGFPWLFYQPLFALLTVAVGVGLLFIIDRAGKSLGAKALAKLNIRVVHTEIERQDPSSPIALPITDTVVKGRYTVTAGNLVQVNARKAQLVMEFQKEGQAKQVVLGEDVYPDPNTGRSSDMMQYPFSVGGEAKQDSFIISLRDQANNTVNIPTLLQQHGTNAAQARFFVRTKVAVDGWVSQPEAKTEIALQN